MNEYLPYDPGVLPSSVSPMAGEGIIFRIEGLPPYKDEHFSIRNPDHRIYFRFVLLRQAATDQMGGRAPYRCAVRMHLVIHAPHFDKNRHLIDYEGGVADTLDGCHGDTFTYLPVVFEDDCQIVDGGSQFIKDNRAWYEVRIEFLENKGLANPALQWIAEKAGSH
jgi:hypothetical protein